MARPPSNISDTKWSLLFMILFMPLMFGCLIAAFALGGLYIASPPNALAKLLGAVAIAGAVLLAGFLALLLFSLFTRRFLTEEQYRRWQRQLDSGKSRIPPLYFPLFKCFFKIVRPRQGDNAL